MNANVSEDLYIVAGATSRTGIIVAKRLLELGRRVRVIGRSVERLDPLVRLGAESFVAEPSDADGLTRAFAGASAAYVLL